MINTILIDGDVQSRQRLAELLAAHTDFCIVASCATIEAALGALERSPVDMALLDVDLPDCDAKHFIQEFRQRCGEPLIFLTAPDASYAVNALDAGADYVLLKPYTAAAVNGIVERARLLSLRLRKRVSIRTFGTFELRVNDQPVHFRLSKAQELLALCVARNGQDVSIHTIVDTLWGENGHASTSNTNYRSAIKCVCDTLAAHGAASIFSRRRGFCSIRRDAVDCDFFHLMDGRPGSERGFNDNFLPDYSWAEDYNFELTERREALQQRSVPGKLPR